MVGNQFDRFPVTKDSYYNYCQDLKQLPYLPMYNARPCIIRILFLDYDFGKKINKRKEEVK